MLTSSMKRKLATLAAALALCSAVAGCVSDMGAPTAEGATSHHFRYFGGPKSPEWTE